MSCALVCVAHRLQLRVIDRGVSVGSADLPDELAIAVAQLADVVAAQQCKRLAAAEIVPQAFEPQGGALRAALPQQADHFPVRADRTPAGAGLVDQAADLDPEQVRLRPAVRQDLTEQLAGLDRDVLAALFGCCYVDAARRQLLIECVEVLTRSDDDACALGAQPAADEPVEASPRAFASPRRTARGARRRRSPPNDRRMAGLFALVGATPRLRRKFPVRVRRRPGSTKTGSSAPSADQSWGASNGLPITRTRASSWKRRPNSLSEKPVAITIGSSGSTARIGATNWSPGVSGSPTSMIAALRSAAQLCDQLQSFRRGCRRGDPQAALFEQRADEEADDDLVLDDQDRGGCAGRILQQRGRVGAWRAAVAVPFVSRAAA